LKIENEEWKVNSRQGILDFLHCVGKLREWLWGCVRKTGIARNSNSNNMTDELGHHEHRKET
jgi:hypothetical protein